MSVAFDRSGVTNCDRIQRRNEGKTCTPESGNVFPELNMLETPPQQNDGNRSTCYLE
jgi:hypothetical protein